MIFSFGVPFIRWANTSSVADAMAPRRIYDHELVYVVSGCGHFKRQDQTVRAAPDFLFLIQPDQWHSWRAGDGEPLHLLGVHFDWQAQHDTLTFPVSRPAHEPIERSLFRRAQQVPNWDLSQNPALDLRGRPRVRRALEEVVAEYGRGDAQSHEAAGALLAFAFLQIGREAGELSQLQGRADIGADALRRVSRARELLEAPRETPLSVGEAARRVGWSADHLRRMFRAVLNTSPNKVQTAARVRRAEEILRHHHLPVAEVARQCGFDDASHFARVFKGETGLSPRQFLALAKHA